MRVLDIIWHGKLSYLQEGGDRFQFLADIITATYRTAPKPLGQKRRKIRAKQLLITLPTRTYPFHINNFIPPILNFSQPQSSYIPSALDSSPLIFTLPPEGFRVVIGAAKLAVGMGVAGRLEIALGKNYVNKSTIYVSHHGFNSLY